MPSVSVVPVYIEVSSGFERAVDTLEWYLRRAGYLFHTGEPISETLDETIKRLGEVRARTGVPGAAEAEGRPLEGCVCPELR
jgi:hypothetical protein